MRGGLSGPQTEHSPTEAPQHHRSFQIEFATLVNAFIEQIVFVQPDGIAGIHFAVGIPAAKGNCRVLALENCIILKSANVAHLQYPVTRGVVLHRNRVLGPSS